jgi:CRISPR-associated protein (TIGR03984 family)
MPPTHDLREIRNTWVQLDSFDKETIASDPVAWLAQQARPGLFLLLHADDGIFWGRGADKALEFSDPAIFPRLTQHPELIQAARLFDQTEETFLWRVDEGAWRARRAVDGTQGTRFDYFDEPQILSGTQVQPVNNGFSKMIDGEEGLVHVVPLALPADNWKDRRRLRLDVRHYLVEEAGWLRVRFSRLYNLRKEASA